MKKHFLATLLSLLTLSGCYLVKPTQDLTEFYTINEHSAHAESFVNDLQGDQKIINFIIKEIPRYADSSKMVIKDGDNKLLYSENARWAEPLEESCGRFLRRTLSSFLSNQAIVISSKHADSNMIFCDYRLTICFDDIIYNVQDKQVVIRCNWSLYDYNRSSQALIFKYSHAINVPDFSYANMVDGIKKGLYNLSENISKTLLSIIDK